jgi:GDP/UDP-N,N'-diacetylbacillosamine 2-epimerase (hydrolysing)
MKKICFITGKRGGFDAMVPTLREIENHPGLELQVIACDQHLRKEFGYTLEQVQEAFPQTTAICRYGTTDTPKGRIDNISVTMCDIAQQLVILKPDIVLLIGDRSEILMAAIAAHHLNIPIAHVQGGDETGCLDDRNRHAITMLSTWHFTSNERSRNRVIEMTHNLATHNVGDVHIDTLVDWLDMQQPHYEMPLNPYCVLLFHPDTLDPGSSGEHIKNIIYALLDDTELNIVAIYPCTDPGYEPIIKLIDDCTHLARWTTAKNLDQETFFSYVRDAEFLIGNSSAGIIEAPYLGTVAINVGNRQNGRLRGGLCIDTQPSRDDISRAVEAVAAGEYSPFKPIYGDGTAHRQIVKILGEIE